MNKEKNGQKIVDYTGRDYDSLLQSMRALIPAKLPEWKNAESEADFGNVLLQLFAHMGDILSYYQDRIANESFLGTAQSRRSVIQHLQLIGYRLATAAPASTTLDIILPGDCQGKFKVTQGDAFSTKSEKGKPSIRFEYTGETPLEFNCEDGVPFKNEKGEKKKRIVGIPVEEGQLIRNEVLSISIGMPNQQFQLTHPSLIVRSLAQNQHMNKDIGLVTERDGSIETWTLRESLAFSGGEKDYILEIDEEDRATVIFGDGLAGAIPPKDAVIKVKFYRVGGGQRGNVPARSITTVVDAPALTRLGATVVNLEPATGGAGRESIEHAVRHAPHVFRTLSDGEPFSLKRSVTAQDYQALALDFPGVGKVRAEPSNWNVVTLYVAPERGGHVSDVLRANLLNYFEDKRPLSTIIEVEDVEYVEIFVTAMVGIKSYYKTPDVVEEIKEKTGSLLAFQNVQFGQTLYLSKFYEAIEAIESVEYVNIQEFRRKGQTEPIAPEGMISLKESELSQAPEAEPYNDAIKVNIDVH